MPDPPGTQPLVVRAARVQAEYAARVADRQCPNPLLNGPADDGPGGLMLGLPHPPPVPRLGFA
jgi:hypothetical protein